ncbi:MAG: hypothetical protein ACR2PG_22775, partial [Hyphomicrobiaceae bacterium]
KVLSSYRQAGPGTELKYQSAGPDRALLRRTGCLRMSFLGVMTSNSSRLQPIASLAQGEKLRLGTEHLTLALRIFNHIFENKNIKYWERHRPTAVQSGR